MEPSSSSSSSTSHESFYLLNLRLSSENGGSLVQKSEICGRNFTIEEAFARAKFLVTHAWRERIKAMNQDSGEKEHSALPEIRPTEFGYDLIENFTVLSRYWIHPQIMP